jgi:hypothetical protein
MSLWTATYKDPQRLVALVDLALRNILVGYSPKDAGSPPGSWIATSGMRGRRGRYGA